MAATAESQIKVIHNRHTLKYNSLIYMCMVISNLLQAFSHKNIGSVLLLTIRLGLDLRVRVSLIKSWVQD